jgi:adenine phosphoribosyltransferase
VTTHPSSSRGAPLEARVRGAIRDVPGFPRPGVLFRDLTPVLASPELFQEVVAHLARASQGMEVDRVAGIEARGFLFGAPLALALGRGFIPVRKQGRLTMATPPAEYELEYGTDALEAPTGTVRPGERILLVDDLLATGGTAQAAAGLLREMGGEVVGGAFVVELAGMNGRCRLGAIPVSSLVLYP